MNIKKLADKIAKDIISSVPNFQKFVDEHEVEDYPYGRERTKAIWFVDRKGNKERVGRKTVDPKTGRTNKPKYTTYGTAATIGIGSDGRAYPITGRAGQVTVWSGDMKHTVGSLFSDDNGYNDVADVLGFRRVPGRVTVKETRGGAEIDGLQGKKTTVREIMNLAGLPNEIIDAEVDKVVSRVSKDMLSTIWIVKFKREADKKDFLITVYA